MAHHGPGRQRAARRASLASSLLAVAAVAAPSPARAQRPPPVVVPTGPPAAAPAPAPQGPTAPEDEGMAPHPVAAVDPHPEDSAPPPPWSFSDPLAWPQATVRIDVSGYLLPQFEYVSLPSALPRDKVQYGARGTRVGFALHGTPIEHFSYMAHVVVVPASTESLALLPASSTQGVSISVATGSGTSIDIEEASLAYRPARWFQGKLGVVRMPFSLAQATPIPKQMFPTRAPQTGEFQSGADEGLLLTAAPLDARLQLNAGAFLGSSLGGGAPNQTVRGPAVAAQVAAHPLGAMSLREGALGPRGPLRFALGFATIYRSATLLDATGYETSTFKDTRFAAWARAQIAGVYVQGEFLRRLRTDDLSGRPSVSEGGYVAASYYQPVGKVGFGPVVRAGALTTGIGFAPRKFTSFEGGLAFYPRAEGDEPEKLRILAQYLGASITPLDEVEREALVQLQLEF